MYVVKTVLLLAFCRLCLGNIHPLPASEVRDKHLIHCLSNALSKKVVFLSGYEIIIFYFCLKKTSTVKISSLRYSNGNDSEVITAVLNQKKMGFIVTISPETAGDNWNVFHSSTEMKGSVILERGWYILKLQVHGSDGVELNTVSLDIDDSSLAQDMLQCKLHCTSDLPHLNSSPRINVDKKAKLRQKSYPSKCAEEDNVKILVYLDSVKQYKLIATLPVYKLL